MINGDRILLRSIGCFLFCVFLGIAGVAVAGYFAEQVDIANAVRRSEK